MTRVRAVRQAAFRLGLAIAFVAALAACSSGGTAVPTTAVAPTTVAQGSVLRVEDFGAAVAAVEAARGGPQQYVELNATPEGVNVFVAASPTDELAYFYAGGSLLPPGEPAPQSSPPFALDGIDLHLGATLVQRTQDQFPGSTVVSVALVDVADQGLRWALRSRSALGGLLNVLYTPAGDLVTVAPAE